MRWPVVLKVHKRGRWIVVGKIVRLGGEPVLATAVRHQRGTVDVVSMPVLAVGYAERCGCRWWCYRDDRVLAMRRISLEDLRRDGWLRSDGELYVRLSDMESESWQEWPYVEDVVRLGDREQEVESEPVLETLRMW